MWVCFSSNLHSQQPQGSHQSLFSTIGAFGQPAAPEADERNSTTMRLSRALGVSERRLGRCHLIWNLRGFPDIFRKTFVNFGILK